MLHRVMMLVCVMVFSPCYSVVPVLLWYSVNLYYGVHPCYGVSLCCGVANSPCYDVSLYHVTFAWVTRPERPKGTKDKVQIGVVVCDNFTNFNNTLQWVRRLV